MTTSNMPTGQAGGYPRQTVKLSERQFRVLQALVAAPQLTREQIDRIAGASNGPSVVSYLRCKGFGILMRTEKVLDRDGKAAHPGRYSLTQSGLEAARQFFADHEALDHGQEGVR